ncbi:Chromosome-associated kinesin KIF4 [Galdieria sulphuraria]|nr:Chromosome-associated kinesin KIF4 [Galdieria sulphuraria]
MENHSTQYNNIESTVESGGAIPMNNHNGQSGITVTVAVRVRPFSSLESSHGRQCCLQVEKQDTIMIGKDKSFTFDHVFDSNTSQEELYKSIVLPLINGIFEGFHSCLFAYGQTGSGKTYTMGTSCFGPVTPSHGIIPRVIEDICNHAKTMTKDYEISLKVSFIEIYNEDVRDLLKQHSKKHLDGRPNAKDSFSLAPNSKIQVREDETGNVFLEGVNEVNIQTYEDAIGCLESGAIHRATASHDLNERSSRSHAVFTIYLSKRPIQGPKTDKKIVSQFQLVDLAGSERAKRTNAEGTRLKEGISINTSLLALMEVISVLGDEKKRGSHVPYRRSKLTRILTNSLGGNSKTAMIACISPSEDSMQETLNTLKYAHRARNIRNKPVVNYDTTFSELQELRKKVAQLQEQLAAYENSGAMLLTCEHPTKNSVKEEQEFQGQRKGPKNVEELTSQSESRSVLERYQQEVKSLRRCAHYLKLERDVLAIQIENMAATNKRQKRKNFLDFASHNLGDSDEEDLRDTKSSTVLDPILESPKHLESKSELLSVEQVTPDTSLESIIQQEDHEVWETEAKNKEKLLEWFLKDIFDDSSHCLLEEENGIESISIVQSTEEGWLVKAEERKLEACLEEIRKILTEKQSALRRIAHIERFLLLECNKYRRLIATKREDLQTQEFELRKWLNPKGGEQTSQEVPLSMDMKTGLGNGFSIVDKFQRDTREMETLEQNTYRLDTFLSYCKKNKAILLDDFKHLRKYEVKVCRQLEMIQNRQASKKANNDEYDILMKEGTTKNDNHGHPMFDKADDLIHTLETNILDILKEKLTIDETINQAVQKEVAVVNKHAAHALLNAVSNQDSNQRKSETQQKALMDCTQSTFLYSDVEDSWNIIHLQDSIEALDIEIEYRKQRIRQGQDIISHPVQKCKALFEKIYLLPNVSLQVRIALLEFVKRWLKSQEQVKSFKQTEQKLRQELNNLINCFSDWQQRAKWQELEMESWKTQQCLHELEMIEKVISLDGYEEYNEENLLEGVQRRISNTFLSSGDNDLESSSLFDFDEASVHAKYPNDLFDLDWSDMEMESAI